MWTNRTLELRRQRTCNGAHGDADQCVRSVHPAHLAQPGDVKLLALILHVIALHKEALLFCDLDNLMRDMEANFQVDQSGMHAQLGKLEQAMGAECVLPVVTHAR